MSSARTADSDDQVINAPVRLHSITGGSMDRYKLAVDFMNVIDKVKPVTGESAFSDFIKGPFLGDRLDGVLSPPEFFKWCSCDRPEE